jgi:hypothetical protein
MGIAEEFGGAARRPELAMMLKNPVTKFQTLQDSILEIPDKRTFYRLL